MWWRAQQRPSDADVVGDPGAFAAHARGGLVGGQAPIVHEVCNCDASDEGQVVRQKSTVAPPPNRLAAHHRAAAVLSPIDQVGNRHEERRRLHVVGVRPEGAVPQRNVLRPRRRTTPTAEISRPEVSDARLGDPAFHLLASELWVASAAGVRANIDQIGDLGVAEKDAELGSRQRAVPHGHDAQAGSGS